MSSTERRLFWSEDSAAGEAYRIPKPPPHPRIVRLRRVAWLLDRSIPIGGGWRIGLDPLLGLIPGIGDWLGAACSLYIVYEAARLGIAISILARMLANIAVEAVLGIVPILGDLFDFAWQANIRNLKLVEEHHRSTLSPRSLRRLGLALVLSAVALMITLFFIVYATVRLIASFFS